MTLYFDTKVEFLDANAVGTIGSWHSAEPIFAVASHSHEHGGSITIFSDSGEPQRDVTYPVHSTSQATALSWHPEKILLASGWENGEIHVWFAGHREFGTVHGPHKAPIVLLEFSEQGGRLVTGDAVGMLTGWRCDGQYQFLTMFSHDLRDMLLHVTFRRTIESEMREEMVSLAKAAVAGDENALDTLTNWRPRTAARSLAHACVKDNNCFYVGTQKGLLYYINQGGTCNEVLKSSSTPIMQMLWHPKKDAVICMLEDMTIVLYLVETTGILTELDRVKLSSRASEKCGAICWAGNSLAIITGDLIVRIWDIEKSDNYILKTELPNSGISSSMSSSNFERGTLSPASNLFGQESSENLSLTSSNPIYHNNRNIQQKNAQVSSEFFTCLAFSASNLTLCAGTNFGNLYTWRRSVGYLASAPEDSWQLTNISSVRGAIKQCIWGFNEVAKPCILINSISNVYLMKEQPLLSYHTRDIWAVQLSAKKIYLEHVSGRNVTVQAEYAVSALALNRFNVVVSNGRSISTYHIEKIEKADEFVDETTLTVASLSKTSDKDTVLSVKLMQTFSADCLSLYIQTQNIFCLTTNEVIVYSIGGVVLNKIQANDNEGKIIGMDLTNCFLTVFTMNGFIKAYDVSRHDPKLLFPGKSGYDLFDDFGEVILVKCNSIGTHLAIIIANRNFVPQPTLYCWDFERNNLMDFTLSSLVSKDPNKSSMPVNIYWDPEEPRLLAMEVKSVHQQDEVIKDRNNSDSRPSHSSGKITSISSHYIESEIFVMFYTDKSELSVLETCILQSGEYLVNLCIPNVITLDINTIKNKPLQDFVDLKDCDANTRNQVLNFSLYVAEGNMDMAYRCIRSLKSKAVWTNLAIKCVETNRLDVAKVCLGHLEKARSVRAVQNAIENNDLEQEAKIAVVAIELGMIDRAQELYKSCGRYDLLNRLLQSTGQLDEAIKIAETDDRVHLKNTYYHKAQQLKNSGDINGALEYFEKTQNPIQNITQLLLDHPHLMKKYMQTATDPKLLKWWGQYIESSGDMDAALVVYQKAEDWFSQVKILCYLGQISKADSIARQSGDRAACYHLARHYENVGKYQEAIMFYTRAQTFSNAIRICKENDFQDELWTVAISSRSRDKATAAAYFEECGSSKRAVELYHRAGMLHKALEMAFESEQPDILEIIASELTSDSDPELINRCADFFISIEQYQKAVHLLAKTKQLNRSLRICVDKGVPITEDLAELLTPQKGELDEDSRISILTQLGELLQEQGDYHTATKKFTQAGDKVRGMRSLLKSGNTDKIIFFANMSRNREAYIMAANYLQSLNWHEDANILKYIVTFYSKGHAYDSLANFYAICSQIEIEENHDYEKALKAMHEAAKSLEKSGNSNYNALNNLQRTIGEVKTILDLQNSLKMGDNQAVITGCRNILDKQEIPPIRHSDVMSMLIRALVYSKQYFEAGQVLKALTIKDPSWRYNGYVEKSLVQKIANECNLEFDLIWNSGQHNIGSNDESVDEDEIKEEIS